MITYNEIESTLAVVREVGFIQYFSYNPNPEMEEIIWNILRSEEAAQ